MPAHFARVPAVPRLRERVEVRMLQEGHEPLEHRVAPPVHLLDGLRQQLIEVLLAVVLQVEPKGRPLLLDVGALARDGLERLLDDLPVFLRIDARDPQQKPLRGLLRVERLTPRRQVHEDQQLHEPPGEVALRLAFEQRGDLAAKIGEDLLRNRQELGLHLEQIGEVVDDRVRGEQVPPGAVEKRRHVPGFVPEQLGEGEIDDAARLREAVAHFFEQLQRRRVNRVDVADVRDARRQRRVNLFQVLCQLLDGGRVGRFLAQDTPRDEVTDVRRGQEQPDRVAVLDLAEQVVLDLARVFDLFLQRGHDPQPVALGPLAEELQETEVFVERLGRRLGAQELRQLVYDEQQAGGITAHDPLPDVAPVLLGVGELQLPLQDGLQRLFGPVVQERHRDHAGVARSERLPAQLLGEVGQEMRFPRAVVTDQENAAPLVLGEQRAEGGEVRLDLFRDVVAVADPARIFGLQMLQAHDRRLRGDIDVFADVQSCPRRKIPLFIASLCLSMWSAAPRRRFCGFPSSPKRRPGAALHI